MARVARMRWHSGVLAWALWALAMLGVATIPWFDHLLRQAGRPELTQLDATAVPLVLAALIAATVGAVLASRRPRHPVGWLLLALGLAVTASGVADGYARYGLLARPGALPAARWRGRVQSRDPLPGVRLHRLRAAAHPERIAALAPLALVGPAGGSRTGWCSCWRWRSGPDW